MAYYFVFVQFCRYIGGIPAHNTHDLEIGSNLKSFYYISPDIAVSDNGCFNFLHIFLILII